jgi:hypothetical protein
MRLLFPVAQAASSTSAAIIRIRIELLMKSSLIVGLSPKRALAYIARVAVRHIPFPRNLVAIPSTRIGADPGGPAPSMVVPGCYAPGGTMIVSSCRAGVGGG